MSTYHLLNIKPPAHWGAQVCPLTAQDWLHQYGMAAVFYGTTPTAGLLAGKWPNGKALLGGGKQLATMLQQPAARAQAVFVTIDEGSVWTYTAAGGLRMSHPKFHGPKEHPKVFPISNLQQFPLTEVPLILASMRVNQHFARNTFTTIDGANYPGNIAAIDHLLGRRIAPGLDDLDLLSSIELETLVAKLLEEGGAFVPAYKGGFLAAVDLLAYANNPGALSGLNSIQTASGRWVASVQVKARVAKGQVKDLRNWLNANGGRTVVAAQEDKTNPLATATGVPPGAVQSRSWFKRRLDSSPKTKKWLKDSTKW